jgi:hypothetical protein
MPGSPSISTAPPRPSATSVTSLTRVANSVSRPISTLARGAVGTDRIVPSEHFGNKRYHLGVHLVA